MRPLSGNSSISMREVIITKIFLGLDQKNIIFVGGGLGSSLII